MKPTANTSIIGIVAPNLAFILRGPPQQAGPAAARTAEWADLSSVTMTRQRPVAYSSLLEPLSLPRTHSDRARDEERSTPVSEQVAEKVDVMVLGGVHAANSPPSPPQLR